MPARAATWRAAVLLACLALAGCDRERVEPAAALALAGAPVGIARAEARWEHRFRPTAALDRMDAEVCFHGRVPARLEPQVGLLTQALTGIERVHGSASSPLAVGARGIDLALAGLAPGDCVRYTVDLARLTAADPFAFQRRTSAYRHGEDLVLSPDYYLLRPAGSLAQVTMTATFELPPGVQALVPWPRLAPVHASEIAPAAPAAPAARIDGPYRIPSTSFTWRIHGALGRFDVDALDVAGARLRVAMLGTGWQLDRAELLTWLGEAATAVAGLYHGFPVQSAQILVIPVPGRRVVYGNAAQGGGPSIALLVGTEMTAADMRQDWVAVHELLHLGMPTVEDSARWLSEGLATYYEPLLRARAGWITPRAAWEILHDGFQRGRARGSERTLAEESRDMGDTHQYWRVYWAGAAIALIADVALRQHPGAPTLDAQLRAIRDCCLDSTRTWSAEDLLAAVAVSPGTAGDVPDLASVARPFLGGSAFPTLTETYAALGLRFDAQGNLLDAPDTLDDAARELRAAIAGAWPGRRRAGAAARP